MSDSEYGVRKTAIMLLKHGKTQEEVAQLLDRSPRWVAKWVKRFEKQSWQGLHDQSRAPKHHGRRISTKVREAICQTRLDLEAEAAEDKGLKYIGAYAIRTRLKGRVCPLPSVPTIERVLHEARLTRPKAAAGAPAVMYPELRVENPHELHQVDIVPHYLRGGERIACFNAIDVVSRYSSGQAYAQRRAQDATAFLLQMWREMGIARYTQMDNEGCFSGGATHQHVLGQVVRLALTVGTELVFSPVYHPESNGYVERFHQDYNRHVWEETYLPDLAAVNSRGQRFFDLVRLREDHRELHEQSPTTIHHGTPRRELAENFTLPADKLPLREGRIHFMRRVSPEGMVRVLNVNWAVPRFDPVHGVWVTITFRTIGAMLTIFDAAPDVAARECLATYAFPLQEAVWPHDAEPQTASVAQAVDESGLQEPALVVQPAAADAPVRADSRQPTLTAKDILALPLLKHIPFRSTLISDGGRLAWATLQHTSRLTYRAFCTMY
ncbi:MAG: transposase [Anaerolineales bacterium]|nr:transposase [Anaerolineales bacterium]